MRKWESEPIDKCVSIRAWFGETYGIKHGFSRKNGDDLNVLRIGSFVLAFGVDEL